MKKIAFGGGCHWCTEAVFQSLKGIEKVEQGWVSSTGENQGFSEAVIVHFDSEKIGLAVLISIHLHTHKCTSAHSFRQKYRSAVYTFSNEQSDTAKKIIQELQSNFDKQIITEVLPYVAFKKNLEHYQNYYYKDPKKQFCQTFINPKLEILKQQFLKQVDQQKLQH